MFSFTNIIKNYGEQLLLHKDSASIGVSFPKLFSDKIICKGNENHPEKKNNKDLQQCADAVMRLRAEYLYSKNEFTKIIFTDNEGTQYHYNPPYSRNNFDNYLQKVFGMCGSASLQKQLRNHVEMKNIQPGDVLIHGGFPGHAVIVMDVAVNNEGKNIYLLAQSYMPAQDIHVLQNPSNKFISPWYEVNDETMIETPEYSFSKFELKRW